MRLVKPTLLQTFAVVGTFRHVELRRTTGKQALLLCMFVWARAFKWLSRCQPAAMQQQVRQCGSGAPHPCSCPGRRCQQPGLDCADASLLQALPAVCVFFVPACAQRPGWRG